MEINNKVAEVQGNAVFDKTVEMSIDNENMAHIMNLLTDMYADSYVATAREVISNALDASLKALGLPDDPNVQLPRPIEVTTPSVLGGSALIVRDYGVGMSRDTLENVYTRYGSSTKRSNNVEVGGFGLGAKSPLSIADSFVVISVQDGKKNTVIFQKNEAGKPVSNFLEEEDTTEPNGTIVTVTVDDANRMATILADPNTFIGYPANSVSVDGRIISNTVHNPDLYVPLADGSGWLMKSVLDGSFSANRVGYRKPVLPIVVGSVYYEVELKGELVQRLTDAGLYKGYRLQQFFSGAVVMYAPVGTLSLTPARDNLIMDSRTLEALVRITGSTMTKVQELIEGVKFEDAEHAYKMVNSLREIGSGELNAIADTLTYHGELIPNTFYAPTHKDAIIWAFGESYRKGSLTEVRSAAATDSRVLVYGVADRDTARTLLKYLNSETHATVIASNAPSADGWDEIRFGAVYSYEDYLAHIVPIHKEALRVRREARKAQTPEKVALSRPVSILSQDRRRGELSTYRDSASNLQGRLGADGRVFYVGASSTYPVSRMLAEVTSNDSSLHWQLARSLRNLYQGAHAAQSEKINGPVYVIRLPKGSNANYATRMFPNAEDFGTVIDAYIADIVANLTDAEVESASLSEACHKSTGLSWLNNIGDRAGIENPEVKRLLACETSSRTTPLDALKALAPELNNDTLNALTARITAGAEKAMKYESVLLSGVDTWRLTDTDVKEIVDYINSKFPAEVA